jgi:hypothetical protein
MKAGDFGWFLYPDPHPLKKPCKDCPFKLEAEGKNFLRAGRMEGIKFAVSMGQPFWCHETIYNPKTNWITDQETGTERLPAFQQHWRMCKGAADFVRRMARKG